MWDFTIETSPARYARGLFLGLVIVEMQNQIIAIILSIHTVHDVTVLCIFKFAMETPTVLKMYLNQSAVRKI